MPYRGLIASAIALWVAAAACSTTSSSPEPGPLVGEEMPRADLTPGATDPRVTQSDINTTICGTGYSKSVRPALSYTSRVKRERLAAYGDGGSFASYELDHLIPIGLGGAPSDDHNLWPQPWERRGGKLARPGHGAESKDRLEGFLHNAVCTGRVRLADAQHQIATDWLGAYRRDGLR